MYTKKPSGKASLKLAYQAGDMSAAIEKHNSGPSTIAYPTKSEFTAKLKKPHGKFITPIRLAAALSIILSGAFAFSAAFNIIETGMMRTLTPSAQMDESKYTSLNSIFEEYRANVSLKISVLDGAPLALNTPKVTVGEIIDSLNIELDDTTVVNYALDEIATDDMEISVDSFTYGEITLTDSIPYATEVIQVDSIPKGTKKVIRQGIEGTSTRVLTQEFKNGELISETVVSEKVTKKPQNKIIYEGVGGSFVNEKGETIYYSHYIDVTATAYGSNVGNKTFTGKKVKVGMIAVDPTVIPLGTKVYVKGNYGDYGVCYAEDIGGGIKGKRIDVYLGDDLNVIKEFGRRKMRVYILEDSSAEYDAYNKRAIAQIY